MQYLLPLKAIDAVVFWCRNTLRVSLLNRSHDLFNDRCGSQPESSATTTHRVTPMTPVLQHVSFHYFNLYNWLQHARWYRKCGAMPPLVATRPKKISILLISYVTLTSCWSTGSLTTHQHRIWTPTTPGARPERNTAYPSLTSTPGSSPAPSRKSRICGRRKWG